MWQRDDDWREGEYRNSEDFCYERKLGWRWRWRRTAIAGSLLLAWAETRLGCLPGIVTRGDIWFLQTLASLYLHIGIFCPRDTYRRVVFVNHRQLPNLGRVRSWYPKLMCFWNGIIRNSNILWFRIIGRFNLWNKNLASIF